MELINGKWHRSWYETASRALRSDTPTLVALVDVSCAPNASTQTHSGVSDRSAQRILGATVVSCAPCRASHDAPAARLQHLLDLVLHAVEHALDVHVEQCAGAPTAPRFHSDVMSSANTP
jgi:hypothetical protein